jgi:CRISPR/Cas system CSM-associated protein Csm4 (group 5 of RAMP superfamily)
MVYSIAKPCYVSSCSLYSAITVAFRSLYIYISLFINPFYIKNIYLTSLFLVDSLLALYFAKYSLNHLSAYPVRNNPV